MKSTRQFLLAVLVMLLVMDTVRDDKTNDAALVVENKTARRGDTITIELRSGGGFLGRFLKQ